MLQIQGDFTGYLATKKERAPGVVLLQEIFGINAAMRFVADQLADDGFTVLAPDLFWRLEPRVELDYEGPDYERARALYQKFDRSRAVEDIGEAIKALREHEFCSGKVALVGFCLGGLLAYLSAAAHRVEASAAFYGVNIPQFLDRAPLITCPMQLHFGEADSHVPPSDVAQIRKSFASRKDVQVYTYPDAGHAFFNSFRKEYCEPAARLARLRLLEFLRSVL